MREKVTKKEMEEMLVMIWEDAKLNWTYGGEGADNGRSPVGWVISSDSGIMGKFRDLIARIKLT